MKVLIFVAKWTGTILLVIATIIFALFLNGVQSEYDAMCYSIHYEKGWACHEWNERSTWWNPKGY